MMNSTKNSKGLTLIEIIVAIAIMGILAIAVSTVFNLSISQIFSSGSRTAHTMEVQEIVDKMLAASEDAGFHSEAGIDTYLGGEGYRNAGSKSQLTTMVSPYDVNYFIEERTISGVTGYEVTIVKFYDSGNRSVQLTTFIL